MQYYSVDSRCFLLTNRQTKSLRSFSQLGKSFCAGYKKLPSKIQNDDDYARFVKALIVIQKPLNRIKFK